MPQQQETCENTTAQNLVERIRAGQRSAEAELVSRYSRAIMLMLERRTGDIQRAEDVHQDTFCIVLQRLRTRGIDDPASIASFLHSTAINVLIGDYRKESRRRTYPDSDLVQRQKDRKSDQLRQLIRDEADSAVRAVVLELGSQRDREILYRFYILQQEKPVVCKALNLTSEHFDRVVSRARQRFRRLIEKKRLPIEGIVAEV